MQRIAYQLYLIKAIKKKKKSTVLTLQELIIGKQGAEVADAKAVTRSHEVVTLRGQEGGGERMPSRRNSRAEAGGGGVVRAGTQLRDGTRPAGWWERKLGSWSGAELLPSLLLPIPCLSFDHLATFIL